MVIESKRKKKKEENNNSGNNGLTSLLKCSCYAKINRCRDSPSNERTIARHFILTEQIPFLNLPISKSSKASDSKSY